MKEKFLSIMSIICVAVIVTETSCKKDAPIQSNGARKVQYILYTDKDLSKDDNIITFKLSMQNSGNQIIWDSTLAPMKIKDIPNSSNKFVFEKLVPDNDPSTLKVGFYYSIENVGDSWHLEAFKAGVPFKIIDFNFQ